MRGSEPEAVTLPGLSLVPKEGQQTCYSVPCSTSSYKLWV